MTVSPTPSADQIIRLYGAGNLAAELAQYHLPAEDGGDTFLQRCIAPHNSSDIDLVAVAFKQEDAFDKLSAITTGYWPIVLAACHHFRLPVPPQFWRRIVAAPYPR